MHSDLFINNQIQQMNCVCIYDVYEYELINKTLHCPPDFVATFIYKAIAI